MPQIAGDIADFVKHCMIIVVKLRKLRPILVLVLLLSVVRCDIRVVHQKSCMTKQNVCCADCVQLPDRSLQDSFPPSSDNTRPEPYFVTCQPLICPETSHSGVDLTSKLLTSFKN